MAQSVLFKIEHDMDMGYETLAEIREKLIQDEGHSPAEVDQAILEFEGLGAYERHDDSDEDFPEEYLDGKLLF